MPVDTKASTYIENYPIWMRCRHCIEGEDAVKNAGTMYLPMLGEQTNDDYIAYKQRALFFNASGRTVDSFVGMVFRKDPDNEYPDQLSDFAEDVTLDGKSLYDFEKHITKEVISVGRIGSLVDWNEEEQRAYVAIYPAEQIINWQRARINGKTRLSMVVLHEKVTEAEAGMAAAGKGSADQTVSIPARPPTQPGITDHWSYTGGVAQVVTKGTDTFNPDIVNQIRVLKLVPAAEGADWIYTVEIWQETDQSKRGTKTKEKKYVLKGTSTPMRRGRTIGDIPFIFHGPNNLNPECDKSPMTDIASVNISHYRNSADLEHGRHYTGLPTPYVFGIDDKFKVKLGSHTAITSADPQTKCGYMSFGGEGLAALEKAIDQKEHQMAVLGARMLEREAARAETIQVMQMKQTGEQASLAGIAATTSRGVEMVLRWALWWVSPADSDFKITEDQINVELNSEFNPTDIDPVLVTSIVAAVQAGLLSKDSAVYAFKKGELVSPMRTVEEELDLIESETPTLQGQPMPLDPNNPNPQPAPAPKGKEKPAPKPKGGAPQQEN